METIREQLHWDEVRYSEKSCAIFMLFDEASDGSKLWGYVGTKADSLS
jgi:hypothetical protein